MGRRLGDGTENEDIGVDSVTAQACDSMRFKGAVVIDDLVDMH